MIVSFKPSDWCVHPSKEAHIIRLLVGVRAAKSGDSSKYSKIPRADASNLSSWIVLELPSQRSLYRAKTSERPRLSRT